MSVKLLRGDCMDHIRRIDDNTFDSVVTDPPYGIGFMGKGWDTGDLAFNPEFWSEVLRVLKPGGYVASFAATRCCHRMACAIEDAGFEIRDTLLDVIDPASPVIAFMESLNDEQLDAFVRCIEDRQFGGMLAWMYGTGFPKSHNVSKAIDNKAGAKRKVVSSRRAHDMRGGNLMEASQGKGKGAHTIDITEPSTADAKKWNGWGTALKPAFEPIVLARKPLSEKTVSANVLRWGTGAMNLGACMIGNDKRTNAPAGNKAGGNAYNMSVVGMPTTATAKEAIGRWPANVIHDGSDVVVNAFPSTGPAKSGGRSTGRNFGPGGDVTLKDRPRVGHDDAGGTAARFFFSGKASKADRAYSKHPTVKRIATMQWLVYLVTRPGGLVLDPFAGSGTTGVACVRDGFDCVLIEREREYQDVIAERLCLPKPVKRNRIRVK